MPVCLECDEEVSTLWALDPYQPSTVCAECLEHLENEAALRKEEERQALEHTSDVPADVETKEEAESVMCTNCGKIAQVRMSFAGDCRWYRAAPPGWLFMCFAGEPVFACSEACAEIGEEGSG